MSDFIIKCPHCGAELPCQPEWAGREIACSQCNGLVRVGAALPASAPPAKVTAPAASPASVFPERMKANRALAGRVCSSCNQAIELGQDVINCQGCQQTMHQACSERAGGCMNAACDRCVALKPAPAAAPAGARAAPADDMMECKFCRELIKKGASKCRHCGELQGAAARAAQARKERQAELDEKLNGWEILFGILCGGIACIVGLVWAVQGKKKGWKLIAIAICSQLFFGVIQALVKGSR